MKIVSQTSDDLVLKDGGVFKYVFGVGFMVFGLAFAYAMYASGTHGAALAIPAVLFLIGLLSLLFIPTLVVDFNKTMGQITYQVMRVTGAKITLYAIADVDRLEARKQWRVQRTQNTNQRGIGVGSSVNERLVLMVQSILVFKDGKELPLDAASGSTAQSTGSSLAIAGNEVSVAKQVADFLNVPFQEIEPPQIGVPM
jgi:hypothetical protein